MQIKRSLAIICLFMASVLGLTAQTVGIKTNLISDAVTSPNVGVEIKMAPKWTFDLSGQVNFWNIHERRWRHWMVMPEARWWWCEAFQGNFLALHVLGGQYNVGNINPVIDKFLGSDFTGLKDHRYQGWAAGAGIGYGHDWILSKHWNIEFEIGIGWIYTRFDQYPCTVCGEADAKDVPHNYFGPTKLSLAIEYIF